MSEYVWGTSDHGLALRVFKYLQQTWANAGAEFILRRNQATSWSEIYLLSSPAHVQTSTASIASKVANAFTSGWRERDRRNLK